MSTVLDRPIHDLKVKLDRKNLQDVLTSYTDREEITDIAQLAGHLRKVICNLLLDGDTFKSLLRHFFETHYQQWNPYV